MKNKKTIYMYSYAWNSITNFKAFFWNISLSTNLFISEECTWDILCTRYIEKWEKLAKSDEANKQKGMMQQKQLSILMIPQTIQ